MNLGDMEYLICEKHNTRSWKKGDYCDECKVEQLEAENARLREELKAIEAAREGLAKFYVSAVVDAKRYRWLRRCIPFSTLKNISKNYAENVSNGEVDARLDAAIDSAMKEQP